MKFTATELADLRTALEVCKLPLQCPGKPLGHEDVPRTPNGLPIVLMSMQYIPECAKQRQHLACPHHLTKATKENMLKRVITLLERINPNLRNEHLLLELGTAEEISVGLDNLIRVARTNADCCGALGKIDIPDAVTAQKNAAPIEEEFMKFAKGTVEPVRVRMLQLIEEAIEGSEDQA